MCSVCDIENVGEILSVHENLKTNEILQKCKKCGETSVLILQKKDPFCKSCFLEYAFAKFCTTIGKSKKIARDENVLLCCSGGVNSTSMLHLTKFVMEKSSHKKLCFKPGIIFINESALCSPAFEENHSNVSDILDVLISSGYPVIYTVIEMVFRNPECREFYWSLKFPFREENYVHLQLIDKMNMYLDVKLSSKQDYLKHLRLQLLADIAHHAGYTHIFVGNTSTNLAVDVLSDIALGRGSQIAESIGFHDVRLKVPVCRPMREFLNEETVMYNYFNNHTFFKKLKLSIKIKYFLLKTGPKSSIQELTEKFILSLQDNFPATIFTLVSVGGKLSKNTRIKNKCVVCKSSMSAAVDDALSIPLSCEETCSSDASNVHLYNREINACHGCLLMLSLNDKSKQHPLFLENIQNKV